MVGRSRQLAVCSFIVAAAFCTGPSMAQDKASGPSTSGGSLPYISGKDPAADPVLKRPKAQAPKPETAAMKPPAETITAPAAEPAREATKPAEAPAPIPAAQTAGPPKEAAPAIEAVAPQPPATDTTTTAAPVKPAQKIARTKPTRNREAARKTQGTRKTVTVNQQYPSVDPYADRYVPRTVYSPPPVAWAPIDPWAPRYAARADVLRPYPPGSTRRIVIEEDGGEVTAYRPARPWGFAPYPYLHNGAGASHAPALRPYRPNGYVAGSRAQIDENCHVHAYRTDGMRFHRDVRCHLHERGGDPSLRSMR